MANYEATKYDFSGSSLQGLQGVNTGIIVPWSNGVVPSGFLECNGAAVSQSTYADLFAVIGTTYGDPGGGNFNLPDLTDRVIVSRSPTLALATTGGADSVAAVGNITGNAGNTTIDAPTMASHTHSGISAPASRRETPPNPAGPYGVNATYSYSSSSAGNAGGGGAHTHTLSANFTGGTDSVLQPYLVVMYIIKT